MCLSPVVINLSIDMLKEITIKNFKSIANDTIELGRVNVFIGENGCGKSNILEAVGFASAGVENRVDNENLISKGVRVAKPSLIISNFKGRKQAKQFNIEILVKDKKNLDLNFTGRDKTFLFEEWEVEEIDNNISTVEEPQVEYEKPSKVKSAIENLRQRMKNPHRGNLMKYVIYSLNTPALRGFTFESRKDPIGIYGEGLDILLASFDEEEMPKLKSYSYLIPWLEDFFIDAKDVLKFKGYKPNRSASALYFVDKHMPKLDNVFSLENANEGVLHILFYLAVTISHYTPKFFAIDNIESCLNPHLCRHLMEEICKLAKSQDKQLLITTHNPAILDGLNLFDDEIRLFEVTRNDKGHTQTRRIQMKPEVQNEMGQKYKLSELWTRGFLGAISTYPLHQA
ncbi:SMC domain protein [Haliscomenobacter hydrossis DSM 1100]|uniref:SMC domain protein n=2 Tax=Haliscomenobacter TaxID=2349 RepID=F4KZP5_HALH1|nr:SMC domain protein [Haliscomenobacter hydrossis DSM 1100]